MSCICAFFCFFAHFNCSFCSIKSITFFTCFRLWVKIIEVPEDLCVSPSKLSSLESSDDEEADREVTNFPVQGSTQSESDLVLKASFFTFSCAIEYFLLECLPGFLSTGLTLACCMVHS